MQETAKLVQELLLQAVEIEDSEKRAAFLAQACNGNLALRRELEELLKAHDAASRFLPGAPGEPVAGAESGVLCSVPLEKAGDRIGRYKLLQQIGEGGCGVVYMAEQEEPVRRKVALKVIKLGMDTKSVVARFEAERQALALMDHPNIARVLDAGATETGRPFFVMELVRGIKITEYCDQNELSTPQRLELFVQVCQAVQHAHQKGIIHRDLKPSNILVTVNDDVAVPKVIDFGIAKATGGRLTDQTLFTAFEQFLGTPDYVSPEQAAMTSLDIDTRSDIYSLGVLLYELLTGKTPFDTKALLASGLDELRRVIREKEPVRPSTRVSTMLEAERTATAKRRQTQALKLISLLRGDLDWIVVKCLEKDRARRYETANGLARDIERHLNCEPVLARPPSRLYEFQRTVRRHRVGFAALAAVLLALATGAVVSTWQATRAWGAEREQSLAREEARQEAMRARQAEAHSREQLWSSYLAQAKALRLSHQPGSRPDALKALKAAAEIRPGLELRNEAIAALALLDLQTNRVWPQSSSQPYILGFDLAYGRYVCGTTNGFLSIRRTEDDGEVMPLPGYRAPSEGLPFVQFSPDDRFLFTVSGEGFYQNLWDLSGPRIIERFDSVYVAAVAFSPDSRRVAISFKDKKLPRSAIWLYDVVENRLTATLEQETLASQVRFHPSKNLLSTCSIFSNEVKVWDLASRTMVHSFPHPDAVWGTDWHPDGNLLATACHNSKVYLWDLASPQSHKHVLEGHDGGVVEVSFSFDGAFLASRGWDGTMRIWETATDQPLFRFPCPGFSRGFSHPHYRFYHASGLEKFAVSELVPSGECRLLRPQPPGARAQTCDFSRDGKWLLTVHEDGARIWSVASGKVSAFLPEEDAACGVFGPGADYCMIASKNGIKRWSLTRDNQFDYVGFVSPKPVSVASTRQLLLSRDGATLVFPLGEKVHILTLASGEEKTVPRSDNDWTFTALSGQGKLAVAWAAPFGETGPVRVFDSATTKLLGQVTQHGGGRALFSPDDQWLLVGDHIEYSLWDTSTWQCTNRIPKVGSGAGYVGIMAFSPDSKMMALAFNQETVRLLETTSGTELASLTAPEGHAVWGLQFSPDGSQLAVLYGPGPIQLWDLRLIRQKLAEMHLDWDLPPFPPASQRAAK